jgi:hypothetical protein
MELESSQRELQDYFRPHPKVSRMQTGIVSRLHFESLRKKCHLNVASMESYRETIWGKVVASPESKPW